MRPCEPCRAGEGVWWALGTVGAVAAVGLVARRGSKGSAIHLSMGPLDLRRLASRIERLQRVSTHDWHPADELEFKNHLPTGRARNALPQPDWLRKFADDYQAVAQQQVANVNQSWRTWITTAMRLESLESDNRPGSVRRMMRDIQRGRWPR